ncbi:capsid cement protein [Mesorhizobium sp.]|uniref:capsid cement protein n=1 Tax=Mesorhizobium sp. TaxID=1871066 RepID=UPI000FEA5527|nr:capsid cement protein [Mesorhizobium sp.]RWC58913.1 MAG: hypothetical protein EOS56_18565 [Mesorhizobium sp.]RWC66525.1 MAG: hypothetical protein EOS29_03920 [Mesorhizobium sp.]
MIPTFIRSYAASAAIAAFRFVAFSDAANSQTIAQGAAATDPLIGVSDKMGGDVGDMVDVVRGGLASITLGGTVAAGDPLTSDASGKAIKCVAATGVAKRVMAWADQPGVANDIIDCHVAPSVIVLGA